MTYTYHYVSADGPEKDTTWSVYCEQYDGPDDEVPIDGTQKRISQHATEAQAHAEADRLQRLETHRRRLGIMSGPEHYREAERLVAAAAMDMAAGNAVGNRDEHDTQVARAQVHAMLAHTAAVRGPGDTEWLTVLRGEVRDEH